MGTLVNAIISYIVPSITLTLIMWVIKEIKKRAKHDVALEEGVKCLLRDRIIQGHRYHAVSGNAVLQANLDYVTMIAGIDIPLTEEETINGTFEELQ